MTTAEKYVTAAYCVVFAVVLVYVLILALKVQRLESEVEKLTGRAAAPDGGGDGEPSREPASVG